MLPLLYFFYGVGSQNTITLICFSYAYLVVLGTSLMINREVLLLSLLSYQNPNITTTLVFFGMISILFFIFIFL